MIHKVLVFRLKYYMMEICYRKKKKNNIKNIQNLNNKIIGEMMRENLIN